MVAVFQPEEPSPPLTPERLKPARQLLNDEERKILEAMERDLASSLDRGGRAFGSGSQARPSSSHALKILPDELPKTRLFFFRRSIGS